MNDGWDSAPRDKYTAPIVRARDSLECFTHFLTRGDSPFEPEDFTTEMGEFDFVTLLEAFVTLYRHDGARNPDGFNGSLFGHRREVIRHLSSKLSVAERFTALTAVAEHHPARAAQMSIDLMTSEGWPSTFLTSPAPGTASRSAYESVFRCQYHVATRTEYLRSQVDGLPLPEDVRELSRVVAESWDGTLDSLLETALELVQREDPLPALAGQSATE
jgi:hypothetical protein